MQIATVRSPAKLNLTFDILGIRADGFHDVETVFQTISLEDELQVSLEDSPEREFYLSCADPYIRRVIPLDRTNLIAKAFELFMDELGSSKSYKVSVALEKRIPVGAGLAGGSGNAAAMLLALNELLGKPFSHEELMKMGLKLGSDVPFCLQGGTAIGRGRGELLEPIERKLELCFCVVKPLKLSVSTPWAFKLFDEANDDAKSESRSESRAQTASMSLERTVEGLEKGDLELALSGFGNVFQALIFKQHPELMKLREDLLEHGVFACQMTGSGPTLFAVIPGREMGHHIRRQVLKDDEIGYYYGTEDVILEAHPPIDFRLAEAISFGAHLVSLLEVERVSQDKP